MRLTRTFSGLVALVGLLTVILAPINAGASYASCTHAGWVKGTVIDTATIAGVFGDGSTEAEARIAGTWKSRGPDYPGAVPADPDCYHHSVNSLSIVRNNNTNSYTYCYINGLFGPLSHSCSMGWYGDRTDTNYEEVNARIHQTVYWVGWGGCSEGCGTYHVRVEFHDYYDGGYVYYCWMEGDIDPDTEIHCDAGKDTDADIHFLQ